MSKVLITVACVALLLSSVVVSCAEPSSQPPGITEFAKWEIVHNGNIYYVDNPTFGNCYTRFTGYYIKEVIEISLDRPPGFTKYSYHPNTKYLCGTFTITELTDEDREVLFK